MLKINNIHISRFGGELLEGSLKNVLSFPAIKSLPKNDWAEYHGSEYDVSIIRFDKKEVTLHLLIAENQYNRFVQFISDENVKEYYFEALNLTFLFRFLGFSKVNYINGWFEIEVKLSEDNPNIPATGSVSLSAHSQGILLNNKYLHTYGIALLEGSKEQIISLQNAKKTLEMANTTTNGVVSAPEKVFYEEKNATLKCFIRQPISDFLKGYYSFFKEMISKKINTLDYQGITNDFIYKSSKITDFYIDDGMVWAEFDLQIIIIK